MPNPAAGLSFAELMAQFVRPEKFAPWLRKTYGESIPPSYPVPHSAQGELFPEDPLRLLAPLQALREARLEKPGGRARVFLGNIPPSFYREESPLRGIALRSSPDVGEDWFDYAREQRFRVPHFDLSGGAQALARLLHNREYPGSFTWSDEAGRLVPDPMPSMMISGVPVPQRPLLVTDREVNSPFASIWKKMNVGDRGTERFDRLRDLGYDAIIYPNKYEGPGRQRTVPWVPQNLDRGYPYAPLNKTPLEVREELARRFFAGEPTPDTSGARGWQGINNPAMVLLDRGALADVAEHRRAGGSA